MEEENVHRCILRVYSNKLLENDSVAEVSTSTKALMFFTQLAGKASLYSSGCHNKGKIATTQDCSNPTESGTNAK